MMSSTPAEARHRNYNPDDFNQSNEGDSGDYTNYFNSRYDDEIDDLDDDRVEKFPLPIIFGLSLDSVTPNFGDPRSGGDRSHEGLDLMANRGAPIVSPTEAVVTRISDGANSGLVVYTANPGGERFVYMHLDSVADFLKEGDELKVGDLIGFVGNTGNASATAPHLHFEVRDGQATDPYERITSEFTMKDKIKFLNNFWDDIDDEDEIAEMLVDNFSADLFAAQALDLELPNEITELLEDADGSITSGGSGDLTIGDSGQAVVTLQVFLIAQKAGRAAADLAAAGATGNFGGITKAALAEWQELVGIEPASGYYGSETRRYIDNMDTDQAEADEDSKPDTVTVTTSNFAESLADVDFKARIQRYLKVGVGMPTSVVNSGNTGSQVVWLQEFLINRNVGAAAQALAAAGSTGYYGNVTKAALMEYQLSVGIAPTGIYDQLTKVYLILFGL